MGEIINLSEKIKENLKNKKEKYPNLREFQYDDTTDTLTFRGESFSPAGFSLIHTDPAFFELVPESIFAYLKNGFYYQSPNELSKIKNMIAAELVITEEEVLQLKKFVVQYLTRLTIYMNNKHLIDSKASQNNEISNFLSNLLERGKVIDGAKSGFYKGPAAQVVKDEYEEFIKPPENNLNTQEETNTQTLDNSMDRGMSLTRKSPKNITYIFPEQQDVDESFNKKQYLGMAGFTSIVLIIATAITFGMYLALKLM